VSYILDSSAIFKTIRDDVVETLMGNYTVELARYELGNTLWKQYAKNSVDEFEPETIHRYVDIVGGRLGGSSIE